MKEEIARTDTDENRATGLSWLFQYKIIVCCFLPIIVLTIIIIMIKSKKQRKVKQRSLFRKGPSDPETTEYVATQSPEKTQFDIHHAAETEDEKMDILPPSDWPVWKGGGNTVQPQEQEKEKIMTSAREDEKPDRETES